MSKDSIPVQYEFSHIQTALQAVVGWRNGCPVSQTSIDSICSVLDMHKAQSLITLPTFIDNDGKTVPSVVPVLSAFPNPSNIKDMIVLIQWNLRPYNGIANFFYPRLFYDRASFRFDGRYVTAQYFFDTGLGIVLRLGGDVAGPLAIAWAKETMGKEFVFSNSKVEWRLISIFAGNTAAEGPEWPGYPSIEAARDAHYKEHKPTPKVPISQDLTESSEHEGEPRSIPLTLTFVPSGADSADDSTQLSPSDISFDVL